MATQVYTNGVTLTDAAEFGRFDSAAYAALTGVAGTNTITATGPASYTYAASRPPIYLIPANTNTGATTINVTPSGGVALGARNIFRNGLALVGGELKKNQPTALIDDGTQFNIVATAADLVQRDIPSFIAGLTYANNGADATNDLDIAAGVALDGSGLYLMRLATTLTKQSDVAWAVGSGNGGLDTGAVGNSDYYIWLIARSDTGVVDALYSLSSTAPTMPTNYDFKRLIGWFKRVGATIVAFHTYETEGGGIEMNWDSPTLDVNLGNTLTTSRRTDAVKVPLNFSTKANLNIEIDDATTTIAAYIYCPDQTDLAPSSTAAPLATIINQATASAAFTNAIVRTSATGLIAARASSATMDNYRVSTLGFTWARRN